MQVLKSKSMDTNNKAHYMDINMTKLLYEQK